jgi:hypothetical protein
MSSTIEKVKISNDIDLVALFITYFNKFQQSTLETGSGVEEDIRNQLQFKILILQ